ncbi:MAG: hypothetical protein E6J90_42630 [Deltaproteobacteria bacterium]|nr:MAG: hypothetical protein E6J91_48390 [Deltaproteobacteria bacterium]TMQ07718.1 MAG: hypothetical protein E6J90_42630 [Deltaproteobacteria bacterium]
MVTLKRPTAATAVVAGVAAAACLSLPPYRGEPLMSYQDKDEDGGATITGSGFVLHFASGSGFHLPDSLKVGDAEVMGHVGSDSINPMTSSCDSESETGIKLAPTPRISPDSIAPATQTRLTAVLSGPVVVQVRIDWATHFMCAPLAVPGGTSTFTVFPEGRIVRHDKLNDPTQPVSVDGCACPGSRYEVGGTFYVSSFWTFAQAQFGSLNGVDLGASGGSDDMLQPVASKDRYTVDAQYPVVCFDAKDSARQVASAWDLPPEVNGQRASTFLFGTTPLVGHRIDKPFGSNMLDLPWDIHGAVFLEHAGCAAAAKRAHEYLEPSPLRIDEGNPIKPSLLDGMYGGERGDGGRGIDLGSDRATLSPPPGGTVPGPFAVWLTFKSSIDVPRATLQGGTSTPGWYEPQRVDGRNWILWFRDPLMAGQMIAIAPL